MPPPAGSQVSRVPAQRAPSEDLAPPRSAPAPPQPRRRLRKVLMVITGAVATLCLAGGITGYVIYDRATTPDRSAPDVVVDNYLRAYLVNRNDVRAGLLVCENNADVSQIELLRNQIRAREKQFETSMSVSWGRLPWKQSGNEADVQVDLTFAAQIDGIRQTDRQSWRFTTRLDETWRVCSAARTS
ncbi:hypothetical protein D0Q02_08160 [Micromonospora craniellae]|uniref:Uncharacterized protein n=1 Tax=Micromonospora craniellae TaxID=2294034 RepID=A0A372G2B9_9ACTN|nr:hypothetical protein [Micromonospora craniellae]QOC95114.1 hypothetical protein ID554_17250 [Micromonospora craniellae]RFS47113.1 hypothetical protein D0Q02_08160 [Micromonospora craniellae]